VAKGGADAPDLVRGNGSADAAAADEHARVHESAKQSLPHRASVVGMIDRIRREGAEIEEIVAVGLERCRHVFLEQKPGVVTAYGDPHGSAGPILSQDPLGATTLP
jgi:hypothetical protein